MKEQCQQFHSLLVRRRTPSTFASIAQIKEIEEHYEECTDKACHLKLFSPYREVK